MAVWVRHRGHNCIGHNYMAAWFRRRGNNYMAAWFRHRGHNYIGQNYMAAWFRRRAFLVVALGAHFSYRSVLVIVAY